jgi:hypothetical protein
MPKPPKIPPAATPQYIPPPAYTPSRAQASVITAGAGEPQAGFGLITNSGTGNLASRANTGKTLTTGGV